jgi:hypothetical protein
VAHKTFADGQPDDDSNNNNDGKNYKFHFHVLEPHLASKLPACSLEGVSLSKKQLERLETFNLTEFFQGSKQNQELGSPQPG